MNSEKKKDPISETPIIRKSEWGPISGYVIYINISVPAIISPCLAARNTMISQYQIAVGNTPLLLLECAVLYRHCCPYWLLENDPIVVQIQKKCPTPILVG